MKRLTIPGVSIASALNNSRLAEEVTDGTFQHGKLLDDIIFYGLDGLPGLLIRQSSFTLEFLY